MRRRPGNAGGASLHWLLGHPLSLDPLLHCILPYIVLTSCTCALCEWPSLVYVFEILGVLGWRGEQHRHPCRHDEQIARRRREGSH